MTQAQSGETPPNLQHGHDDVTVEINGAPATIHRGSYTTQDLKLALGVDASLELDLFEAAKFVPLVDGQRTVVREGMIFISHVRQGSSA